MSLNDLEILLLEANRLGNILIKVIQEEVDVKELGDVHHLQATLSLLLCMEAVTVNITELNNFISDHKDTILKMEHIYLEDRYKRL